MSMAALLFGFAMVDNILLLFISVYNIITLSDLEIDIINVRQACSKLNQVNPRVDLNIIQLNNTKQITFCNACTISIQTKTMLLMSMLYVYYLNKEL
ncbi:unnamed protein product [Rotaria magnacalcarata]|uniref:Uncharacterized protein n=1 Tax=Rotaria magnacalcarata TaxID=392030 RepID=A0A8S2KKR9_9BILA|nr:unnamed protein product [Rotaria magnacalcarata]CAF3848301.1 unnamed protein product [Rotaria magnacalcarata]